MNKNNSKSILILDYDCYFSLIEDVLQLYLKDLKLNIQFSEHRNDIMKILESKGDEIDLLHLDKSRVVWPQALKITKNTLHKLDDINVNDSSFFQTIIEKYPHLKIVFVTSWGNNNELEELKNMHIIQDYLIKPFDIKDYVKLVRNILR
ncbi:hypothetical protein ACFLSX_01600 [Calditrichota bacterium]